MISYYTQAEAAEVLGISRRRINQLVHGIWAEKGLVKVGPAWLIPRTLVDHYAATRRKAGRPRADGK